MDGIHVQVSAEHKDDTISVVFAFSKAIMVMRRDHQLKPEGHFLKKTEL